MWNRPGCGIPLFCLSSTDSLLKLHGWVRNRINGDVETLAEGPKTDLDYLLEKLKEGPEMAHVIEAKAEWLPYKGDLPVFTVLPTDY